MNAYADEEVKNVSVVLLSLSLYDPKEEKNKKPTKVRLGEILYEGNMCTLML